MNAWILTYLLSTMFAATTSAVQLSRGCRELNPLAPQHPAWNAVYKGGVGGGIAVGLSFTIGHHPTLGKTLTAAAIGVNLADGARNLMQTCR